jgi:hypothetical protein
MGAAAPSAPPTSPQPPWCEDERALSSMYGLQHMPAPSSQDDTLAREVAGLVGRCLVQYEVRVGGGGKAYAAGF